MNQGKMLRTKGFKTLSNKRLIMTRQSQNSKLNSKNSKRYLLSKIVNFNSRLIEERTSLE